MNYDIIHMVRTHGEDGTGNDVPIMDVLKRLGRHRKKIYCFIINCRNADKKTVYGYVHILQGYFRLLMRGECYGAYFR